MIQQLQNLALDSVSDFIDLLIQPPVIFAFQLITFRDCILYQS